MQARILFVSDLHKRDCDFSTIAGYTKAVDAVQYDILKFVKENSVTHLVSLGDWYDKGFRSINRANNDRNLDEALSSAVNGNFYICLGNHFFLERDNNPEMYSIQPSQQYKPSQPIYADRPIIRAVPALRVGPVQISFHHFSKEHKEYISDRDPDATFHIGVYHDDVVIPTQARNAGGFHGNTLNSVLDATFHNVDMAIVGHVHKPLGVVHVPVEGRTMPMIIPGALAHVQTVNNPHTSVKLPMIDIDDDGRISCSLPTFELHVNMLRFYKRKDRPIKVAQPDQVVVEMPKTVALPDYLRGRGFTEQHLRLVDAASESQLDVVQGLRLLGLVGGS